MSSSSGTQNFQYKKREKGKQSQPLGRQLEGGSSSQFNNVNPRHEPRMVMDNYMPSVNSNHASQSHQRHRQADSRQTNSTGDSSYVQNKQNRRKDQKLSAESGGTDFNQNQSTTNQQEESKNIPSSSNYQYEGNTQGNATNTQRTSSRANVPHLNIVPRPTSPEFDQRNYGSMGLGIGGSYDEDVVLDEHEVSTPRRKDQLENESKKTSGASTPSRDGADTPRRKNDLQQLGENKGFIHDLTASNVSRKYPIEKIRGNPQNSDNGINMTMHASNNTYSQMPFGDQMESAPQFNSQNSYEERKNNEGEMQNDRDNNYWEREQEQQHVRDSKNRWDPSQNFE